MSHTTDIKPDEEVKYGKLSVRSIGVSGKVEVHDTILPNGEEWR